MSYLINLYKAYPSLDVAQLITPPVNMPFVLSTNSLLYEEE